MVRQVDAIFTQGAFRPLEPFAIAEGTRVHLSVEEDASGTPLHAVARLRSPKLARPEDAADLLMDVQESNDAGV